VSDKTGYAMGWLVVSVNLRPVKFVFRLTDRQELNNLKVLFVFVVTRRRHTKYCDRRGMLKGRLSKVNLLIRQSSTLRPAVFED
jgi:hypothetical protein